MSFTNHKATGPRFYYSPHSKYVLVLFCLLFALSSPAYSAEQDQTEGEVVPAEDTAEDDASQTQDEQLDNEPTAPVEDRFIPSSKISEDLSVSFPVNI